jgi:hypothetical protein
MHSKQCNQYNKIYKRKKLFQVFFDSSVCCQRVGYSNLDWFQVPQDDCLWFGFCFYSDELPGFMKDKEFLDHNQLIGNTVLKTFPQHKTSALSL